MIVFDTRCRRCCCKHYNQDYQALHPMYDVDEPISSRIEQLMKEEVDENI